jgi:aspartyl/asparaginyl-tRNA synthetase
LSSITNCTYAAEKWGSEAVFITGFPASEMKFYHYRSTTNPDVAERFDLPDIPHF